MLCLYKTIFDFLKQKKLRPYFNLAAYKPIYISGYLMLFGHFLFKWFYLFTDPPIDPQRRGDLIV